ncbi:ADP-ribosylation/Crystallin J1 [Lasiosphaeria ovina]|uniref:ADP-ribosylhydrolase ARH3 n=1 Tax=Lasiosphaeria ovina TaxID=92902 RepID=A0AAE0TVB7_9PEZI|nr:ADP-ribosylation/Crystallin J1 [Lasiosphaeria ovina]
MAAFEERRSITSPSRQQRILGALLGVHAGDALGATVEFEAWEEIRNSHPKGVRDVVGGGPFDWPAGHATDDTDLTRAVLLAYRDVEARRRSQPADAPSELSSKNRHVATIAAQYMVDWYDGKWPGRIRGQPPRDIGGATTRGIYKFKKTADVRNAGAGMGSAGNGSLMRCIPTALFTSEPSPLESESILISAVTHNDPHCTIACAAYNAMVSALLDAKAPADAWQIGRDTASRIGAATHNIVTGDTTAAFEQRAAGKVEAALDAGKFLVCLRDLADKGPVAAENGPQALPFKGAGYVLESLTIAVAALFDPRPLEEALVDVVRIGRDTDTNAAIAGGILGARDGVDAIPPRWREKLQFAVEFTEVVDFMLVSPGPQALDPHQHQN